MENYYYTGITAHIGTDDNMKEDMGVLAHAIIGLYSHPLTKKLTDEVLYGKYADIANTDEFHVLEELRRLTDIDDYMMPKNAPLSHFRCSIERILTDDEDITKLYIPVCDTNEDQVITFVQALQDVLFMLFDYTVISIEASVATNQQDFADAKEESLFNVAG